MATTHYLNLNKPTGSDLVNPLTDTFPNWDIVDEAYHEIDTRSIGRATEIVSQGVHAITLLDTDCKTFKFVATGNYSAGETFTVNGIQANAYTPGGSALVSNAFITGSIVIGSLNDDNTAITFYVTGSAVADDSLKLGGELPSYYATQSDMSNAETDITNLKNQAGNNSIVGIGDGTLSGAISSLNNDLSDKADKTSTVGYPDFSTVEKVLTANSSYTAQHNGWLIGSWYATEGSTSNLTVNTNTVSIAYTHNAGSYYTYGNAQIPIKAGDVISIGSIYGGSVKLYGML